MSSAVPVQLNIEHFPKLRSPKDDDIFEGETHGSGSVGFLRFAISLQDLQKGSKILAADGEPIEVLKVEVQKAKKLLDLERPGPITLNV